MSPRGQLLPIDQSQNQIHSIAINNSIDFLYSQNKSSSVVVSDDGNSQSSAYSLIFTNSKTQNHTVTLNLGTTKVGNGDGYNPNISNQTALQQEGVYTICKRSADSANNQYPLDCFNLERDTTSPTQPRYSGGMSGLYQIVGTLQGEAYTTSPTFGTLPSNNPQTKVLKYLDINNDNDWERTFTFCSNLTDRAGNKSKSSCFSVTTPVRPPRDGECSLDGYVDEIEEQARNQRDGRNYGATKTIVDGAKNLYKNIIPQKSREKLESNPIINNQATRAVGKFAKNKYEEWGRKANSDLTLGDLGVSRSCIYYMGDSLSSQLEMVIDETVERQDVFACYNKEVNRLSNGGKDSSGIRECGIDKYISEEDYNNQLEEVDNIIESNKKVDEAQSCLEELLLDGKSVDKSVDKCYAPLELSEEDSEYIKDSIQSSIEDSIEKQKKEISCDGLWDCAKDTGESFLKGLGSIPMGIVDSFDLLFHPGQAQSIGDYIFNGVLGSLTSLVSAIGSIAMGIAVAFPPTAPIALMVSGFAFLAAAAVGGVALVGNLFMDMDGGFEMSRENINEKMKLMMCGSDGVYIGDLDNDGDKDVDIVNGASCAGNVGSILATIIAGGKIVKKIPAKYKPTLPSKLHDRLFKSDIPDCTTCGIGGIGLGEVFGRVFKDSDTFLSKSGYTKTKSKFKGASMYRDKKGLWYYRDTFHTGESAHIEVFSKNGKVHLGEMKPDGTWVPNSADSSKSIADTIK